MRLAVGVGLAPALLRLLGVPRRVVVAEDLEHLLRVELDAHLLCLHYLLDRDDHPVQPLHPLGQQLVLSAQVIQRLDVGVVEQLRDLAQPERQLPVADDLSQPFPVAVLPVSGGGAVARRQQADLVMVVQRAHRHAGPRGDLSDRVAHVADLPRGRLSLTWREGQGRSC